MSAIKLENLTLRPGEKIIIDGANLELERSSRTALLGASGSGKTSILRTIAGFISPSSGRVWLFGENVTKVPPEKRNISMLFQEPVLFPRMTVKQNALIAMSATDKKTIDGRIESLAFDFKIHEYLDRRIENGMSGGERQRAALVRTFSNEKEILLLDEPLRGALNIELKWQLLHAIRKRIVESEATTLVVTHDFAEAAYLAEQIVVLHDLALYHGTPYEIYNFPPNQGVALVLGPGNTISAELIRSADMRDSKFPLVIEGELPPTQGDTDWIFFRPEKLSLQPATVGFRVIDNRFVGNVRKLRLNAPNGQEIEAHIHPELKINEFASVSIKSKDIVVFDPFFKIRKC